MQRRQLGRVQRALGRWRRQVLQVAPRQVGQLRLPAAAERVVGGGGGGGGSAAAAAAIVVIVVFVDGVVVAGGEGRGGV